jgi:EamA domain-containing membrane protein RarD
MEPLTGLFAVAAALPVSFALGMGVGYGAYYLAEKCQNLGVSASYYLDCLTGTYEDPRDMSVLKPPQP